MSRTINQVTVWPLRTLPKDIGVGLVVLGALLLGLLLRTSVEGQVRTFESADKGFTMQYPASWRTNDVTDTIVMLRAEDPRTASTYKTNITVESRELDQSSPPTLQDVVDRRVVQQSSLMGYHFLSKAEGTLDGKRSIQTEYAFVVPPLQALQSASLPVVAESREYVVVTKSRVYYITLAAPESDFSSASREFDKMIEGVKVQ